MPAVICSGVKSGSSQGDATRVYQTQRDQDLAMWREHSAQEWWHWLGVQGKYPPTLKPHNSVYSKFWLDLLHSSSLAGQGHLESGGGASGSLIGCHLCSGFSKMGRTAPIQVRQCISDTPWIYLDLYTRDPGTWLFHRTQPWAAGTGS